METGKKTAAKLHFHASLILGLVPFAGLCIELFLLRRNSISGNETPEHKKWTRRFLGLFFVDLLCCVIFAILFVPGSREETASFLRVETMGVMLFYEDNNPGARVVAVDPDSPADKGGIIRKQNLPERDLKKIPLSYWISNLLILLLFCLTALIAFKKHSAAFSACLWAVFIYYGGDVFSFCATRAGREIFGMGDFSFSVLSISIFHVILLLLSIPAMRRMGKQYPEVMFREKELSFFPALGLGLLYVYTILIRISLVLAVLKLVLPLNAVSPEAQTIVYTESLFHMGTALLLAPLGEEVLFRGILLPGFLSRMKPERAIGITALAFALIHIPGNGYFAIVHLWLGIVLGWLYYKTGRLAAPVALHVFNNALFMVWY
ncbi:MAG: CPBP family intramembrane metalloprotease [bacterium]|nr:CPBP family intramembrane metalloprotease [bacterium]